VIFALLALSTKETNPNLYPKEATKLHVDAWLISWETAAIMSIRLFDVNIDFFCFGEVS
jgi:hypothetical protein